MKYTHKHWMVAGLLAATATLAGAQTPPPAAPQGAGRMGQRDAQNAPDPARMQQHMARMQERRAQRLADFKQKLQLSPGQENAWNSYVAALAPTGKPHERADLSQLTTPERIDRMRTLRAERMAEMDRRAEATKSFYAILTAEQKKVFDDATAKRGGHHHGHHPRA